jgi:hypothetical protein
MVATGTAIGAAFAIAILAVFVHRPPECGEPSACDDDYLFPALYFSGLALISTMIVAAGLAKRFKAEPRRYFLGMPSWSTLLSIAPVAAYITVRQA